MDERTAILGRMFVVLGLILLLPALIIVQLFRINVVEGDNLRELWNNQAINYINIPAQRGNIYDVNGSLLATNTVDYRLAVDPHYAGITRDHISLICNTLVQHTGYSASTCLNRVNNAPAQSRYVVLERNLPAGAYDDIRELDLPGVILEEEYKRSYSFGSLAAHTLGFVNHELTGMTGLERFYDEELSGEDGLQQVRRDRSNRIFAYVGAPRKTPIQGHSLHTTIDSYIQAILEEELETGVKNTRADYGTAIVMDPRTGAIKAMANYPTYDPNYPATADTENRRNFAIADMIEPGSTFKLVTAIAAVEQKVVDFNERFETPDNGQRLIHGQMMRDHDPLGTLDFTQAFAQSSNIAVSEIAMRLTPEVFYQYARNLGFGSPTNIDLPNEMPGRLQKPYEWSLLTLPWMSIGYEVQVTPIQLLQSYSAFANNGIMMRPYVVEHITDEFGKTVIENEPEEIRRIAKNETLKKLIPVFTEVVSDSGTAGWASVDGLPIAGKTGTAQKYMDGRYQTAYRASFIGFFPVDKPRYAILVMLDEPKTSIYGGYTAGQIFKQAATRIAGLDNDIQRTAPPDSQRVGPLHIAYTPSLSGFSKDDAVSLLNSLDIDYKITGKGSRVLSHTPAAGEPVEQGTNVVLELSDLIADSTGEGLVSIPDLRNKPMRLAMTILAELGLELEIVGSGTIHSQFPQAGERMQKGRTVTVRGRGPSLRQSSSILTSSN